MAEFVKKVATTVKGVASKTKKKVTKVASVTKNGVKLKAKEVDLDLKIDELGKLYYAYQKSQKPEDKEKVDTCLKEAKEIEAQILELKTTIGKTKGHVKCPSCGEYVSPSKDVCPKCNATMEHMKAKKAEPKEAPNEQTENANGEENK